MTAITSIGATVAACSQENQPNEAPDRAAEGVVREARGAAGDRVHRAELGVHEREQQDRDGADAQEMTAAGPAEASAPCAPNSQPEPMIEPPDAQSSPMKPISRRRPRRPSVGPSGAVGAADAMQPSSLRRR